MTDSGTPISAAILLRVLGVPIGQWDDHHEACFRYACHRGHISYYFDSVKVHGADGAFLRTITFEMYAENSGIQA
jgi:hypothetical protein